MPMFFFISGFVMYKKDVVWNTSYMKRFFKNKIHLLFLAPIVFFLINIYVQDIHLIDALLSDTKAGYWFTFVLLFFFLVYAIVRFLIKGVAGDIVLLLLGISMLFSSWPQTMNYLPFSSNMLSLFCFYQWQYFIYFVIGTLAKKYNRVFEKLLDGKWLISICVLYYFLANIFFEDLHIPDLIFCPALTIAGILIVFSFFRNRQDLFSKKTTIGKTLQFVGRRTLDIYWIHFFLIPNNLSIVTVFKDHPMPVIETFTAFVVAVIITVTTLLVSSVIRLSPLLAHYLFGAKK